MADSTCSEVTFLTFLNFPRFLYDCPCLTVCSLYLEDGYSPAPDECVVDPLELRKEAWYKMSQHITSTQGIALPVN